jgi:hypothetical protein
VVIRIREGGKRCANVQPTESTRLGGRSGPTRRTRRIRGGLPSPFGLSFFYLAATHTAGRDAKLVWRAVAPSDRAARPPRRFPFFCFLFKFLLSTIFLIYKLCVQLIFMEKVMHTNRSFTEKLCTQVVVSEKIYTQVILQVVMHTSCTHKFCSNQTLCLKII